MNGLDYLNKNSSESQIVCKACQKRILANNIAEHEFQIIKNRIIVLDTDRSK